MTDVVTFAMSLGPPANLPVGRYLRRLLTIRDADIREKAEAG